MGFLLAGEDQEPSLDQMKRHISESSGRVMRVFPSVECLPANSLLKFYLPDAVLQTCLSENVIIKPVQLSVAKKTMPEDFQEDDLELVLNRQLFFINQFDNVWKKTREERRILFEEAPKMMKNIETVAAEKLKDRLLSSEQIVRKLQEECTIWHYNHMLESTNVQNITEKLTTLQKRTRLSIEKASSIIQKIASHCAVNDTETKYNLPMLDPDQMDERFFKAEEDVRQVVVFKPVII
jgi:hypothetical protein